MMQGISRRASINAKSIISTALISVMAPHDPRLTWARHHVSSESGELPHACFRDHQGKWPSYISYNVFNPWFSSCVRCIEDSQNLWP